MKPHIDRTGFGSITIGGEEYDHDVVIGLDGMVRKRRKKLSKAVYGSSHTVSLEEAENIYDKDAETLIIGTGQSGYVRLSEEAEQFFQRKECRCKLAPTPEALKAWNQATGRTIALFHVTC